MFRYWSNFAEIWAGVNSSCALFPVLRFNGRTGAQPLLMDAAVGIALTARITDRWRTIAGPAGRRCRYRSQRGGPFRDRASGRMAHLASAYCSALEQHSSRLDGQRKDERFSYGARTQRFLMSPTKCAAMPGSSRLSRSHPSGLNVDRITSTSGKSPISPPCT